MLVDAARTTPLVIDVRGASDRLTEVAFVYAVVLKTTEVAQPP
jgi:hypothetical protein